MQRRPVLGLAAALALSSLLAGCPSAHHPTGPQMAPSGPTTVVPQNALTPSGSGDESKYGGSGQDVPDLEADDTCTQ